MSEVRALRSFKGRYGYIRAGQTFNPDPSYAKQLVRSGLVAYTEKDKGQHPGPDKDRSIPEAPGRGGKEPEGNGDPQNLTDPPPPADGKGITSASVQAGPASRQRTSSKSVSGGRKGKPTPRAGNKTSQQAPAGG